MFCGFNQKMLEGLIAFHEGLVEHGIVERSKTKGQSVEETLQRELSDMERFLSETSNLKDLKARELIEDLTKYAVDFYRLIQKEGVPNYKQTVRAINNFYVEMDRKFYSELEGKPNDMKQLVEYLNTLKI